MGLGGRGGGEDEQAWVVRGLSRLGVEPGVRKEALAKISRSLCDPQGPHSHWWETETRQGKQAPLFCFQVTGSMPLKGFLPQS